MRPEEIFSRDPGVMGGELVFAGTRVPVEDLVEHLKGGDPLIDFTAHSFDGVTREQAVAFLEWALDAARRQADRSEEGGAAGRSRGRRVPGSFKGKLVPREDFDDPLPDGVLEDWLRGREVERDAP